MGLVNEVQYRIKLRRWWRCVIDHIGEDFESSKRKLAPSELEIIVVPSPWIDNDSVRQ
jgi:hypothetical protein